MADDPNTPVLEEQRTSRQAASEAPQESNNRGNFTRNVSKETDEQIARKIFFGGLVFLPWLHLVNIIYFRKQFFDAQIDAPVTMWTRRSMLSFCFFSVLFIAWVLVVQLGWEDLGLSSVMMNIPPENLDKGW